MRSGLIIAMLLATTAVAAGGPVWPPAPDRPRVAWREEVSLGDLAPAGGLLRKITRAIVGGSELDRLRRPMDVAVGADRIFLTCQDVPALVEVDPASGRFRLHRDADPEPLSPVALCAAGGVVFMTDGGRAAVYRFADGRLEAWVTDGLVRPTGVAVSADGSRICVVDTGAHAVLIYDAAGTLLRRVGARAGGDDGLNFPTFATAADGGFLINDTLNYRIKSIGFDGVLRGAFGVEGDGPGTLARPKGVAVHGSGHVYVADAVFDNVQVFDPAGRLLLVVGGPGDGPGEFWSPGGLDLRGDTIYVADTYNDRIQILEYLGEGGEG